MDQNNPTTPITQQPITQPTAQAPVAPSVSATQPQQPIMPTPQTTPTPSTPPMTPPSTVPSPQSHSKLLIIGIIVLVIVLGGLTYLLFMNSATPTQTQSTAQTPTVMPTATTAPSPTPTPDLEQEAEAIDTGNPETDLTELNTEAQSL
jgi:hypothetical protein